MPLKIPELQNTGSPAVAGLKALRTNREDCLWCEKSGVMQLTGRGIKCPACHGNGQRYVLKADFAEVHPAVAPHIKSRAYRAVSAEIYDNAKPFGIPADGKMLRRVAFIGGDLPRIKTLKELPVPTATGELNDVEIFCAGDHPGAGGGPRKRYTEADLDDMVRNFDTFCTGAKALPGARPSAVIGHEEEQPLTRFSERDLPTLVPTDVRIAEERDGAYCLEVFSERVAKPAGVQKEPSMPRNELIAKLKEAGVDVSKFSEAHTDAMLTFMLDNLPRPPVTPPVAQPFDVAKFTENVVAQVVAQVKPALVTEVKASIDKDLAATRGQVDQFAENLRRENVQTFCEQMLKEGRIAAWELDKTNPAVMPIDEQLLGADFRTVVRKFTEKDGAEKALTAYDLLVNSIKARRPAHKFTEKVRSGGANGDTAPDEEIGKVERFYEAHAGDLRTCGFAKKEDFIETFKKSTPEQQKQLLEQAA